MNNNEIYIKIILKFNDKSPPNHTVIYTKCTAMSQYIINY